MTGLKKKKKKKTKSSQQEDLQILRREGIGNKILLLTRVQFRQHSKLHQDHLWKNESRMWRCSCSALQSAMPEKRWSSPQKKLITTITATTIQDQWQTWRMLSHDTIATPARWSSTLPKIIAKSSRKFGKEWEGGGRSIRGLQMPLRYGEHCRRSRMMAAWWWDAAVLLCVAVVSLLLQCADLRNATILLQPWQSASCFSLPGFAPDRLHLILLHQTDKRWCASLLLWRLSISFTYIILCLSSASANIEPLLSLASFFFCPLQLQTLSIFFTSLASFFCLSSATANIEYLLHFTCIILLSLFCNCKYWASSLLCINLLSLLCSCKHLSIIFFACIILHVPTPTHMGNLIWCLAGMLEGFKGYSKVQFNGSLWKSRNHWE